MSNLPPKLTPTIDQIRHKSQQVHSHDVTVTLVRKISVYFTWVALRLRLSGNMISVINILISCFLSFCLYMADAFYLLALLLIFIGLVFDSVDGEVARYRDQASLNGLFVDRMNSVFLYSAPYFFMLAGLMDESNFLILSIIGFFASWGMLSIRLTRTYVDSTIIDGLMAAKTKDHQNHDDSNNKFIEVQSVIRSKNKSIFWLVDLILVRQIGISSILAIGILIQWIFNKYGIGVVHYLFEPLVIVGIIYSILSCLAVIYGFRMFVKNNLIENNYNSIKNKFAK
jgi:phosphatidylglycerophosphate synthase